MRLRYLTEGVNRLSYSGTGCWNGRTLVPTPPRSGVRTCQRLWRAVLVPSMHSNDILTLEVDPCRLACLATC